ncbi:MAG: nucleotide-binding universal stress UspA family protein [Acidimicrobiales bacterium]|jgi:nucleotide-binding universal stress UspA family protein
MNSGSPRSATVSSTSPVRDAEQGPIVVGVDGTKTAARACSWSASLAEASRRRLVVAHAYHVGDFANGPDSAAASSIEELTRWMITTDTGGLPDEHITTTVVSGQAGPALIEATAAYGASLLVLGAPHVGAIAPHGLGRVVQHTTSRSPRPIAIVRGLGGPPARSPLLVGVDPVNTNLEAVNWSFALAGTLGVPLEVLTVSDDSKAIDNVEALLASLVSATGPVVDLFATEGDPADELMKRAEEIDASTVVVGQKRRHNLDGRIMGHVPSKMIYQSRRPVVLVSQR